MPVRFRFARVPGVGRSWPGRKLRGRSRDEMLELDVVAVESEAHALLGEAVRFLVGVGDATSRWARFHNARPTRRP